MIDDRVRHVVVQSLHTVPGVEFTWTVQQAMGMLHPRKGFSDIQVGEPLLNTPVDILRAARAAVDYVPSGLSDGDAVVLVGHGTYHSGQTHYMAFESAVSRLVPGAVVGTLLGEPGLSAVRERLSRMRAGKVFLVPFMCVPGHHVRVDILGESHRSWRHTLESDGLEVVPVEKGSLLHDGFRDIWLDHLDDAVSKLMVQMGKEGRA